MNNLKWSGIKYKHPLYIKIGSATRRILAAAAYQCHCHWLCINMRDLSRPYLYIYIHLIYLYITDSTPDTETTFRILIIWLIN